MATLSAGKKRHFEALTNKKGVVAAAAMDQRGSLKKSIAKAKGVDPSAVTDAQMSEFKETVTKVLSPYATAILLDPEYGLPATKKCAPGCGLLLAYEKSGYDNTGPGRIPILLSNWSPKKLEEAGANAVKILLYYSPFEKPEINETKHSWVASIGQDCVEADIPFFLEFVGYAADGEDEKGLEFARKKPKIVQKSMEEFSKEKYHADVLKVEVPVNMQFTEGTRAFKNGGVAYTKKEALGLFCEVASSTKKPFIYLSAGVSDAEYRESLELACEAGVNWNGVLCGRATWKEGIPVYATKGVKALEDWLGDRGVQNIQALNEVINKGAEPIWPKMS